MKISLNQLMLASPLPPNDTDDVGSSLMQYGSRKSIRETTIYLLLSSNTFWHEANKNKFWHDFLFGSQVGKKGVKSTYFDKEYEWSIETVIAIWSILVSCRYYDSKLVDKVEVIRKNPKTVRELIKAVTQPVRRSQTKSSKNTIKNELSDPKWDAANRIKTHIIHLSVDNQSVLDDVSKHVLGLSRELVSELQRSDKISWNDLFLNSHFPKKFLTANEPYISPFREKDRTNLITVDIESIRYIINCTLYPLADEGEPVRDIKSALKPTDADILNAMRILSNLPERLTDQQQKNLNDAIRKINEITS